LLHATKASEASISGKLLLITLEPISKSMAGPAIRMIELARQLDSQFDVTVFSPHGGEHEFQLTETDKFRVIVGASKSELEELAIDSDILFIQANVLKPYPKLAQINKYLIVDLYDPYLFSLLVQYQDDPATASSSYRLMHQVLEKHMLCADFFVCASERQRDYWLGRFCALGRIDPAMYKFDPSLRKLIDVVAFGLSNQKPEKSGRGLRDDIAGISKNDFVLLWGGGVWDWFDPLTVIKAVAKLSKKREDIKLVFMGIKSPNPKVPLMEMAVKAQALAADLGVINKKVFFSEQWIPYEQRVNYLLDADVAVSAHYDLIETRFSFRTRILDYLWAGLPILTTGGDQLAELIESRKAGTSIDYENVDGWAAAIEKMADDQVYRKTCASNSAELAKDFYWSKSAEVLKNYCRAPYHTPAYEKVTMPSIIERAQAVYSRGGKTLVLKRIKELSKDLLR
jgi:glycosyltransferase involved in cell wall biosynthesis